MTTLKPLEASMTRIARVTRTLPMSRLGSPSQLPRFAFQQPILRKDTPPDRGLSVEESAHAFQWGHDSILPYQVVEDYDRSQAPGEMPLIEMSNGCLTLTVAPQLGGRLMSMRDERLGRDLVFCNPVFQPANLGSTNAWFSGGIEWNGLVPGHSPSTCLPVFCGVIETARGPVLRVYEYDRVIEATWQIDLFLPEGSDRLFVHGRIVNADDQVKHAYWWTTVAAPAAEGMRVLSPADYVIEHVLPGNQLERFPLPDPDRFDGSYPGNWRDATSIFFRAPDSDRLFMAALDRAGVGLGQTATPAMRGRKLFYFGEGAGGRQWMDFLSRPGDGDYIEIQSGITPTQNQRFRLEARSEIHWTEAYGAISVDPSLVHDEYGAATRAAGDLVARRFDKAELTDIDVFLTEVSRHPIQSALAHGSAWGRRDEQLCGRPLADGLDFSVVTENDCWDELATAGAFSEQNLASVPAEFAVSDRWVAKIEQSVRQQGETWLHCLLLGIAALDREKTEDARALFDRSVSLRPTWLGHRQRAIVASETEAAIVDYLAAWEIGGAPRELASEIADFLLRNQEFDRLSAFLAGLSADCAGLERIKLVRAKIAARNGDAETLATILQTEFATIREGEMLLSELWTALQSGRLAAVLGRGPTESELTEALKANPIPKHLDFAMKAEANNEDA
ncbi:DUF5107 domain-containing protein [Rhizobium sp. TH2]|uniref:DUF5107 domain-containing protein n=1 Tax=Rhizobium sp. TH2 TaxID=2775403 RepID=UPI0021581117|nr:DUF5107 domain-containing protein [Rhizobium sp. TH2]UVC09456.1 DUF5107 domain-containing protein [Rhizobium sp. TH2]